MKPRAQVGEQLAGYPGEISGYLIYVLRLIK